MVSTAEGATGSPIGVAGAKTAVTTVSIAAGATDVIGTKATVSTVLTATGTTDTPEHAVGKSSESTVMATVLATVLAMALMATVLEAAGSIAEVVIIVLAAGGTLDPHKRKQC
jgi:hypothetical protein